MRDTGSFAFVGAVFFILGVLAFWDSRTRRLPNKLVAVILALGLTHLLFVCVTAHSLFLPLPIKETCFAQVGFSAMGALLGGGVPLLISAMYYLFAHEEGFGFGDVKLLGALGILFGPSILIVLTGACLLATVHAFKKRLTRNTLTRTFAVGPSIALASALVLFLL